ncbi:hypothetical protein TEQG_08838 [Trichophyton equinum CBS 127.97]|uniref:Uncharacterized protein n=1 Tax=Trichophyton equinum (strain ATCC MYA-4606 / CBS 127.97) TaxID=559882 RepID=F2Q4J8_TRIEC|nr:hypothetical protein TEQG_08838 [Trichophyton equinum CBS 127.97]
MNRSACRVELSLERVVVDVVVVVIDVVIVVDVVEVVIDVVVEVDVEVKKRVLKQLFYFRRVERDLGTSQSASRIRITKQINQRASSDLDGQRGLEGADGERQRMEVGESLSSE